MLAECTIYTRNTDGTYTRQTARCHWQDQRAISYTGNPSATITNNNIFVMIPLGLVDLPIISSKDKTQNYIVRGMVDNEVTAQNAAVIMQQLNALTIKAISRNDYSIGVANNHWAILAV